MHQAQDRCFPRGKIKMQAEIRVVNFVKLTTLEEDNLSGKNGGSAPDCVEIRATG